MKCRSVASIWSGAPPSHRVTSATALSHPPTLYTGGSDGSILWWNLSSSDSHSEIKPVAMLCGHASPIVDLNICNPVVDSASDEKKLHSIDDVENSINDTNVALISACKDGILCVWSRGSGHCRRRRKLPPWVGSPSIIRTLPTSSRYVCIGCCFVNVALLSDSHSFDSLEESEASIEKKSQHLKPPKCAVVIVDTYSLTIVQTVFHGNLSIGPLKFMDVVFLGEDGDRHSVIMGDACGRVQLVPILKDSNSVGEDANGLHSQSEVATWGNGLSGGQVVSLSTATSANLIAIVLRNSCMFRLLTSETTVGEIIFANNLLSIEDKSTQSHVMGGMFFAQGDIGNMQYTHEAYENFKEIFVIWNNRGFAIIYDISYLNGIFKCEPVFEIPASFHSADIKLSISFVQLRSYLLRIESFCFGFDEPLQWKPHVTMWSLYENCQTKDLSSKLCIMLGESEFFMDWMSSFSLLSEISGHGYQNMNIASSSGSIPSKVIDDESHGIMHKGRNVSSSMVISENLIVPYAIVYGLFNGEIEVVRFNMFLEPNSREGSPQYGVDSHVTRQYLLGHTSVVLCLAAHQMLGTTKGWSFNWVLVSGSMDCTIRIWDIDTGNLITVLHQHVSPVRQIIFPPVQTERPWSDCFLSVGEDSCIALASLETLRVERMFPGHPSYPEKVVWDVARGYIACLCRSHQGISDVGDVLYIWDVKTGAQERVLRGTASHSMLDHFCKCISEKSLSGSVLNENTSTSSLLLPIVEDGNFSQSQVNHMDKRVMMTNIKDASTSQAQIKMGISGKQCSIRPYFLQSNKTPIRSTCPFPGIATLIFDLASLMSSWTKHESVANDIDTNVDEQGSSSPTPHCRTMDDGSDRNGSSSDKVEEQGFIRSLEECLLRFGLSFLHLWNVDHELDNLLITDMKLKKPENFIVASGLQGDKNSLTLTFPGSHAILELWKSSSEFCAMRSLTMVSIAQRMISLSHSSSAASSALAAFYTRNFAEKFPDLKPPLLQLLVSFWQDESEHVRMAARTLFHCAASRAIPFPLCGQKATEHIKLVRSLSGIGESNEEIPKTEGTSTNGLAFNMSVAPQGISQVEESYDKSPKTRGITQAEESKILAWLESFEVQDWISCVGGTSQDAMTSHIIVAAALAVWYPSLVKPSLASLVVHPLIKLVMAMNEKYSSTAGELLAEGMENTWNACSGFDINRLIEDIFFQIECVSGASSNSAAHPAVPSSIKETLVEILLPSLAMANIPGFLMVIESQIWSTASDSPVHLVSLTTLIRVVRGSPRCLAQYLDKVINFVLHTMDPGNSVMRKTCLKISMAALKEVVHVFPMVALNDTSTRLAVGDAIGEIHNASISVYDMQSMIKIKVLDASGPPGLPNLLSGASEAMATTLISALSFSPDGEGLVAFSENGLMIRWWSLGSVWWEKLSRNFVPVQCTKLIFVPPWEGFSPNSSRSSIMESIMGHDKQASVQENARGLSYVDSLKLVIHNLDLSYHLEWVGARKVLLTRHGQELGTFPL